MTKTIYFLTLTIILLFSSSAIAKLEIKGKLPDKPLLVQDLLHGDINSYHQTWLEPIYQVLSNDKKSECPTDNLICALNESDVDEFLREAMLKYFKYHITNKNIVDYFQKTSTFKKNSSTNNTQHLYLKNNKTKNEIINAANTILDIVGNNNVIILGETPSIIGDIMRHKSKNLNIINIAFSSHPDLIMSDRNKKTWSKSGKNIISLQKQSIYRKYLTNMGISPHSTDYSKKTYIVDYSTGPSITAFLLFLSRWYNEESKELPDIIFLNLLTAKDKHYSKKGKWIKDINPILNMEVNKNLSLSVDTIYINMNYSIISKLVETKDNARAIPHMHAINWHLATQNFNEYPTKVYRRILNIYLQYQNRNIKK